MIVCICEFWRKNMLSSGYLRGIFGAKRCGRITLQRYNKNLIYANFVVLLHPKSVENAVKFVPKSVANIIKFVPKSVI